MQVSVRKAALVALSTLLELFPAEPSLCTAWVASALPLVRDVEASIQVGHASAAADTGTGHAFSRSQSTHSSALSFFRPDLLLVKVSRHLMRMSDMCIGCAWSEVACVPTQMRHHLSTRHNAELHSCLPNTHAKLQDSLSDWAAALLFDKAAEAGKAKAGSSRKGGAAAAAGTNNDMDWHSDAADADATPAAAGTVFHELRPLLAAVSHVGSAAGACLGKLCAAMVVKKKFKPGAVAHGLEALIAGGS